MRTDSPNRPRGRFFSGCFYGRGACVKRHARQEMKNCVFGLLIPVILLWAPSLSAAGDSDPAAGEEIPPALTPFYQSFAEAFDEVLAEKAPELRAVPGSRPDGTDPVFAAVAAADADARRAKLQSAILAALSCDREPGAKARRPFLFARGEEDDSQEYTLLETGGDFDMTPGEVLFTGRPLDAAISRGFCAFFILEKEGDPELFYSRAGDFRADREGFLCLEKKGERYYLSPRVANLDQISRLAFFPNPSFLASEDSVLFRATEEAGKVSFLDLDENDPHTLILRGRLESSNAHLDLLWRIWNESEGTSLAGKGNIQ